MQACLSDECFFPFKINDASMLAARAKPCRKIKQGTVSGKVSSNCITK
jgi:hypothetical protein